MKSIKGQVFGYALMLGLVVIILAMALAPAGASVVSSAMNASTADFVGLDCGNSSINNFVKGTCTILDFSQAYFFGGIILIGLGVLTSKIFF